MYRKFLVATLIAIAVTTLLMVTGVAMAASEATGKNQVTLDLQTRKADGNTGVTFISARLQSSARALGNQSVDFYVSTDFFGQREMHLGTAMTDATGTATIKYQPTWTGTHAITARYSGDADFAPSTVKLSLEVSNLPALYIPEPLGLQQVGQWATVGAGFLIVAVWGVLLFVAIYTIRGIARARH